MPKKPETDPSQNPDYAGRETCLRCFRAQNRCFCASLTPFEIDPLLILLVHPKEFMKTVGTVRIVKLSVKNSILWRGTGPEFDKAPEMQAITNNPAFYPMVLFPGEDSVCLSAETKETLAQKIPPARRLVVFVMDGTWSNARQMIRKSTRLSALPKLSFDVDIPSHYGFRKQPKAFCLSTVEAVILLIENLRIKGLCTPQPENAHLKMREPFRKLVESQLNLSFVGGPIEPKPAHSQ